MLINKKHIIFLAVLLVALMSVAVAVDVNDSNTDSTTPAVTHTTYNTNVQTATHPGNDITNKADNNINETKNVENTRGTTHNLNNDNFDDYVTSTGLTSLVNDNDTLNFTTSVTRTLHNYTINKPINITGNGFTLDLNTIYGYNLPSLEQTKIEFNGGASNSNITNLKFHNTQVFTTTASNIVFDNINVTVDQGVGMSTGYFAMRNGVKNITVKNSYFHAINNTGCSAIVITLGENCTIDNNTVIGEGTVGNLIYLNRWGAVGNANGITQNKNNVISNNTIIGPETPIDICIGIVIGGPHNHIINNTINYSGKGINGNWAGTYDPTTNTTNDYYNDTYMGNGYINNTLNNGAEFSGAQDSFIAGNNFTGIATIAKNSNVKYNIFENTATIKQYSNITNNIFKSDVTLNNNINFKNNNAENSTIYVNGANCDFCGNTIHTLNVSTTATNTRVCRDNNIGDIYDSSNNVVKYSHPSKSILNKKILNNVKTEGEGTEPTIIDVTIENFSDYFNINNNNALKINEDNIPNNVIYNLEYLPSTDIKRVYFAYSNWNKVYTKNVTIKGNNLTIYNAQLYVDSGFKYFEISDFTFVYDDDFDAPYGRAFDIVTEDSNSLVVLNNITFTYTHPYSEDRSSLFSNPILLRQYDPNILKIQNSTFNISIPSNNKENIQDNANGIIIRRDNTTFINNTININELYSVNDNSYMVGIYLTNQAKNIIFADNTLNINGESTLYGIKIDSNSNTITNNNITITTTGTATGVELNANTNTVTDNYLVANDKTSDSAVTDNGENNIVENNRPYSTSLKVIAPETANINEATPITILLKDNTGKLIPGQEVKVTVGDNQTETITTDEDGIAVYNLTATSSGELNLTITYEAQGDYLESTQNITINVNEDKDAIIEQLNDTVNKQEETINTLNETVNNQTKTIDTLNDTVTEQAETIESLNDTVKAQNDTINDLNSTVAAQNDTIQDLQKNLTDADNKVNTLNDTVNSLEDEVKNLTQTNQALNKSLTDANDKVAAQDKEIKDLNKSLSDANDKVAAQDKEIKDLNKSLVDANDKVAAQDKEIKDLNKSLADANKAITDQGNAIKDLDDKVSQLNDIIEKLNAKISVKVTINNIKDTKYTNTATITGTVTDTNNKALSDAIVSVKVDNVESKVVTDSKGVYTLPSEANKIGTSNVTVTVTGDKINTASATKTFKVVKQDTKIKVDTIKALKYKDSLTITGTLTDANNKVISGAQVTLKINTKTATVKTNNKGEFTYTTKATNMGTNNVTAIYNGNTYYNKATTKTTFKVNKQALVLTVDRVAASVKFKDDLAISGKLVDGNGKAVANTKVTIKINTKTYKATTDKNGLYVLKTRATNIGANNITASYAGNTKYNKATAKTSFNVAKQDLLITFDEVKYANGKVTVKGTFIDRNKRPLMNSLARITLNGKQGTSKTNTNGTFTYTTKANKGAYKLTLAYPGNKNYNAYSKTSTINVA